MSFEPPFSANAKANTSPELAIEVCQASKSYNLYKTPKDRFKEFFMPRIHQFLPFVGQATYAQRFWSLRDVSLRLERGQVLGLIGVNGAGKSSLLQLICGVLQPSSGQVRVKGRIAALLELGAGFNPEFTGRENIVLNGTLLGLSAKEIREKAPEIIEFSGIKSFIDQPVKTYSSGMYVRLAFSIATSVDPDILVIDEALSVGDGAFARKSFDRIMSLRSKGVTILFCSHSIYQVEALCQKAIWLHEGKVQAFGPVMEVTQAYNHFLDQLVESTPESSSNAEELDHLASEVTDSDGQGFESHLPWTQSRVQQTPSTPPKATAAESTGFGFYTARLKQIKVLVDAQERNPLVLQSRYSSLEVHIQFFAGQSLPTPNVGVVIDDANGRNITSCSNYYDGVALSRDSQGRGFTKVVFPRVNLLKGHFVVKVFLLCENAILIYDSAIVAEFDVIQDGLEVGIVALEREWIV
jgi:lipopolysaccharide transport system ATP-binding protein